MTELETINVGIVGHIDHGKTTLLHKLSGKWADSHSQELKRGITIKLGYADVVLKKKGSEYGLEGDDVRHVSFVDAPGHEMLMATMLSGAAIVDAAILVVAANEGIKPQTREHVMALQAKGLKNVIVVQNKIDLVEKKDALENYKAIKEFLKGKFDDAPVIPVSAQQEVNLDEVWKALAEFKIERKDGGEPVFLVARSFDINKPGTKPKDLSGTVLGGTLVSGKLKEGDSVEMKPGLAGKKEGKLVYREFDAKVLGLFKGSKKVKELTPGGSMSVELSLDMSIGKSDSLAGNVVGLKGKLPDPKMDLKVKYELFPEVFGTEGDKKTDEIKASEQLLLSIGTSMTLGVVKKLGKGEAELNLKVPVIVFGGDRFAISRNVNGHWRLIGYGSVI